MKYAHRRQACTQERFWFRTSVFSGSDSNPAAEPYDFLTIHEILKGKDGFPGLVTICEQYIDENHFEIEVRETLKTYLDFITHRAAGDLMTTASWMRQFVASHPDYKQDSRIPETV